MSRCQVCGRNAPLALMVVDDRLVGGNNYTVTLNQERDELLVLGPNRRVVEFPVQRLCDGCFRHSRKGRVSEAIEVRDGAHLGEHGLG